MTNKIGATTFTTPSGRELLATHVVHAPRERVFEAWTQPEHLPHWMLGPDGWTMPVCEIDLRPGGAWHYVWRQDDGNQMEMRGAYWEVAAPERLVSTESWGDDSPDTLNTLELSERDGDTTIALTVTYASRDAREAALQTGMKDGMAKTFGRLDEYLQTIDDQRGRRPTTRHHAKAKNASGDPAQSSHARRVRRSSGSE